MSLLRRLSRAMGNRVFVLILCLLVGLMTGTVAWPQA